MPVNLVSFQQHNPPHPGELIQRIYIDSFEKITLNGVADRLGVAHSTFSRPLNGKSGTTPEMAVRLSKVLGGSSDDWLALQKSFDLYKVRQSVDTSALKRIDFSQILVPARERLEVDWATCSRLTQENKDFLQFVKLVRQFYQTGDLRPNDWDISDGSKT